MALLREVPVAAAKKGLLRQRKASVAAPKKAPAAAADRRDTFGITILSDR